MVERGGVMYLIDILIEHPLRHLDMTFTYYSYHDIPLYTRVYVSFGHQKVVGFVLGVRFTDDSLPTIESQLGFKIKPILSIIDTLPIINQELYDLALYLKKHTFSPLITCLKTMLPPSLKPQKKSKQTQKHLKYIYYLNHGEDVCLTPKQNQFLNIMKEKKRLALKEATVSSGVIQKLVQLGCLEIKEEVVLREVEYIPNIRQHILNDLQNNTVFHILNDDPVKPFLLYGITGSGKTDVYLSCCKEVVKANKQVLMLVPEISLTPAMVNIFKTAFGNKVAVLHSRLSDGVRYDEYLRIKNQEVDIVVGTRSAIFAPLDHLGLIILDEEHDASYKQQTSPYYHVRDLALFRMKKHHARLVLGSASPSIESFAKAKTGKYHYLSMPQRATAQNLPTYEIVDMASQARKGNLNYFSEAFIKQMNQCLNEGNQALVLVNRRGYASQLLCQSCGYVPRCPHCDVSLTYHQDTQSLVCHYCNYHQPYQGACPSCHQKMIAYKGIGTQQYEIMLKKTFKQANILRYDFDTTKNKDGHQKMISQFESQDYQILLGTQMIAKGLDFKNVTFVAVLDADVGLSVSDYRSSERVFQLLLQVAGRAGRHKQGHVLIQTYNPYDKAITYGAMQDYESFYNNEIDIRKKTFFPPYCFLMSILLSSKDEARVIQDATTLANRLKNAKLDHVLIVGPKPSAISRMQDFYRYRINIKYTKSKALFDLLEVFIEEYKDIKIEVDVNPYSLM